MIRLFCGACLCLTMAGVAGNSTVDSLATAEDGQAQHRTEIQLDGHTFTLPAGFEIEQVAGPPLVDRPITAAFDDEGRLYVSDSSGSNDKVDKQLADRPHRVVRLEDRDGDGRFDKSTVFADKLMFPEGTMWFDGSLYVATPPSIWKLTDTDGDGVADRREEWFPGKTLTGCANDLHGPYLGPDGWIYWCKGAFAKQTYERVGTSLRVIPNLPLNILGKEVPVGVAGAESLKPQADAATGSQTKDAGGSQTRPQPPTTWSTRASHIFRCRPDGTGLEAVMTGGMDNPVDVVFTPGGERLCTTTFFQHPGGGRRDGLIHAVYGGVYGKVHDVIEGHKRTGDIMPVLTHLGPAAPCGLECYRSRAFGAEYHGNLFACCFNMHKLTRHVLEPDGATFKTRDEDFLVSNNLDFHPTDVLEDADGSLLVVNTGGWYKLCCPTSQLYKPDVLGAIYRIRRTGAPRIDDPRGGNLEWPKMAPSVLASLLDDERPVVRARAIHELSKRGDDAMPILTAIAQQGYFSMLNEAGIPDSSGTPASRDKDKVHHTSTARLNAVWALTRINHPDARSAVHFAILDPDETVRQAAIHSAGLWRDARSAGMLHRVLRSGSAHNRRAAAEAWGRIGGEHLAAGLLEATQWIEPLIPTTNGAESAKKLEKGPYDRVLEHSLVYALIELADPKDVARSLEIVPAFRASARTQRVGLIALDQMDGGGLDPQSVAKLLDSKDPVIKETAAWIVSRRPEWGDALVGFLRGRLTAHELAEAERLDLQSQLAQFASSTAVQGLLASSLHDASVPHVGRRTALQAMRGSGVKEMPQPWAAAFSQLFAGDDAELIQEAVGAVRALPAPKEHVAELAAALAKIARNRDVRSDVRLQALAAVPGGPGAIEPELFDFLRANLNPESLVSTRAAAVDVLTKAKLTPAQLDLLTESLKSATPLELDRVLAAFEQSTDESVGLKLVAALKESPALTALRANSLKTRLAKYSAAVQERAQELYAVLNVDAAKQQERLDELLAGMNGGDLRRGQAVFMGTKAACASCHAIGYLGGNLGPDLTRIGGIRNDRDLLESIAFPNASFVRSYEPVAVATKEGKVFSGILRKDAPDEVILATSATETVRIARDDIDEMRPGTVSVMPSGLEQQLSRQELADLLAFLKACK